MSHNDGDRIRLNEGTLRLPDSLRFLLVLAILGAAGFGAVWYLANFTPEPAQVVKPLPNDRLSN